MQLSSEGVCGCSLDYTIVVEGTEGQFILRQDLNVGP